MIEQLGIALTTLITNQQLNAKKREDSYVIVGKSQTSPTAVSINNFFAQPQDNSLTIYQSVPDTKIDNSDNEGERIFPATRSFIVNAPVVFRGKGIQPPIDEDAIVYFDE